MILSRCYYKSSELEGDFFIRLDYNYFILDVSHATMWWWYSRDARPEVNLKKTLFNNYIQIPFYKNINTNLLGNVA